MNKITTSALQASTILQRNEQICTGLLSTLLYRNEANVRTYEIRAHWHMIATLCPIDNYAHPKVDHQPARAIQVYFLTYEK